MIRRRLVVAIVTALTVIMAGTGVVVVSILENRLIDTVDEQLEQTARFLPPRVRDGASQEGHETPVLGDESHAVIKIGPDGRIQFETPSGPTSNPDPLPDVTGLTAPTAPVTVPSTASAGPSYRAIAHELSGGGLLIIAIPLSDVETTLTTARNILLAAGAGALLLAAAMVWLSIRRGLRPIDHMIDAARRIAGGDLTARTATTNPATEVGQLSTALNTMLDRIELAMATKAESEARLRRFVADASHELRTPLTSIRGYAELHRQGATSPEEVTRGMARIEREARHMAGLVEDLLLLARLDQARPLADDPVDLVPVVEEAVADARAADPHRAILVEVPDGPITVHGDRPRLRQVLDNLLTNVRDHTEPGTTAMITLTNGAGNATLTVADDGPGMGPDDAVRAFERFWQAEPTIARTRRGTGLGLAITAELVAAHHGTIALDTSPGRGASFTITLPTANGSIRSGGE